MVGYRWRFIMVVSNTLLRKQSTSQKGRSLPLLWWLVGCFFMVQQPCPGSLSPGLLVNACTITYLTRWKERGTIRFIPELVHNLASALALRAPLVLCLSTIQRKCFFSLNYSPISILFGLFERARACAWKLLTVFRNFNYWLTYDLIRTQLGHSVHNSQEMLLLPQLSSDFNYVWFVSKSSDLCIKFPHGFLKFYLLNNLWPN